MHKLSVYSPRERCHGKLRIIPELSSWTVSMVQPHALRRLPHRCQRSIDLQELGTSQPTAAASEPRTPHRARFSRFESDGSRARSLKLGASVSALSGAALSVVLEQSGIVHSRIATCDVRGLSCIANQRPIRTPWIGDLFPNLSNGSAADSQIRHRFVHSQPSPAPVVYTRTKHTQKDLLQKRVYMCGQVRYKFSCG